MTKLNQWRKVCVVFVLWAATAIVSPAQTFTTLASFDQSSGAGPYTMSLVQGEDGNFYGTTQLEGSNFTCTGGCGTVFKVTPEGVLTALYNFSWVGGAMPAAGLVQATDGSFYGTTSSGGDSGNAYGTVFKITRAGILTTLHTFTADSDGAYPQAPLFQATDGNFYGTTLSGGYLGKGTVFRITPDGALTILYTFCSETGCPDGTYPMAGLTQAGDGKLYGTTSYGGDPTCEDSGDGCGTVFSITLEGKLTTLHAFSFSDGAVPYSGLVQVADGTLYGTTAGGGLHDRGTVFGITSSGKFNIVHNFKGTDGISPLAGVVQATDGNLYGTTQYGGDLRCDPPLGCGTIFKIDSAGRLATLHDFELSDGLEPLGGLLQGTVGTLYGTTWGGGANGGGTIFALDVGLGPFVTFVHAVGKIGQIGGILGQGFTGTTAVSFNGIPATFTVKSDTFIVATVPAGATTGYVTVTTPSGMLTSNVPFQVIK